MSRDTRTFTTVQLRYRSGNTWKGVVEDLSDDRVITFRHESGDLYYIPWHAIEWVKIADEPEVASK